MQRVVTPYRPATEEAGEYVEPAEEGEQGGDANVEIELNVVIVASELDELLRRIRRLASCRDGHLALLYDAAKSSVDANRQRR